MDAMMKSQCVEVKYKLKECIFFGPSWQETLQRRVYIYINAVRKTSKMNKSSTRPQSVAVRKCEQGFCWIYWIDLEGRARAAQIGNLLLINPVTRSWQIDNQYYSGICQDEGARRLPALS